MKLKRYLAAFAAIVLLATAPAYNVSADILGNTQTDITFSSGILSLNQMSEFTFGSYAISSQMETFPAEEGVISLNVSDLRGTGEGWKITAIASNFDSNGPSLPGATITFTNGTATPVQSVSPIPNVLQTIQLECDNEASNNVAIAPFQHGMGLWDIEWNGAQGGNSNVMLYIPSGFATVGTHHATITWTLSDTP